MQESKKMFAKWEGTKLVGERNFNFKLQVNVTNNLVLRKTLLKVAVCFLKTSNVKRGKMERERERKRNLRNMKLKLL